MCPTQIGYLKMKKNIVKTLFIAVLALFLTCGTTDYCFSQTKDTSDLEFIVREARKQLPLDDDDDDDDDSGMVLTKIEIEKNYLAYYYTCDEQYYDIDKMNKNMPAYKKNVVEMINDNTDEMNDLRQACKKAGVGIAYYYIGKPSGKIAKMQVSVSELK